MVIQFGHDGLNFFLGKGAEGYCSVNRSLADCLDGPLKGRLHFTDLRSKVYDSPRADAESLSCGPSSGIGG